MVLCREEGGRGNGCYVGRREGEWGGGRGMVLCREEGGKGDGAK